MSRDDEAPPHLRIGELSRRVGIKPEVLRAWERRYGLGSPPRTSGGFRLYSEADEHLIRRMLAYISDGVATAEAARLARAPAAAAAGSSHPSPAPDPVTGTPELQALALELRQGLDEFDDARAHAALDRLAGSHPLFDVLGQVVLPYLHELGERWRCGEASVAQEHFATSLLRGRLLALARGWGSGTGPRALLACVPGDQHDLGLLCFGLALRAQGWRITYLGPDTPIPALIKTVDQLQPARLVVTATLPQQAENSLGGLRELAAAAPLALAGTGAGPEVAQAVGALYLDENPISAAATVAADIRAGAIRAGAIRAGTRASVGRGATPARPSG